MVYDIKNYDILAQNLRVLRAFLLSLRVTKGQNLRVLRAFLLSLRVTFFTRLSA